MLTAAALVGMLLVVLPSTQAEASGDRERAEPRSEASGGDHEPQIINGDDASPGEYPFMGTMQHRSSTIWDFTGTSWQTDPTGHTNSHEAHRCGVTLIEDEWAMTAAHCVGGVISVFGLSKAVVMEPGDIEVLFGTTDLTGWLGTPTGELIGVSEVHVHPDYHLQFQHAVALDVAPFAAADLLGILTAPVRHDLALLRLATPATTDPVQIGSENIYAPTGTTATLIGWGEDENGVRPVTLQEVDVPVQDDSVCVAADITGSYLAVQHLCVGSGSSAVTPVSACHGDSGGPALVQEQSEWVQVGVTSFKTDECVDYSAYVGFANTWKWIYCTSGVLVINNPPLHPKMCLHLQVEAVPGLHNDLVPSSTGGNGWPHFSDGVGKPTPPNK